MQRSSQGSKIKKKEWRGGVQCGRRHVRVLGMLAAAAGRDTALTTAAVLEQEMVAAKL